MSDITTFEVGNVTVSFLPDAAPVYTDHGKWIPTPQVCRLVVQYGGLPIILGSGTTVSAAVTDALDNLYFYDYRLNDMPNDVRKRLIRKDMHNLALMNISSNADDFSPGKKLLLNNGYSRFHETEERTIGDLLITTSIERFTQPVMSFNDIPHVFTTTITLTAVGKDKFGDKVISSLNKVLTENENLPETLTAAACIKEMRSLLINLHQRSKVK